MKRHEFLTLFGISAGTVVFAPFLSSCASSKLPVNFGSNPVKVAAPEFTLDLTLPENSVLNSNGGSLIKNGIIVAHTTSGAFIAVASACPHQGANVSFDIANSRFHCSRHGSNFGANGSLINGPATAALKMYSVRLSGTLLGVYS
jgi:cytochrome b6-f complex iron-sulfur subunit